ncbi:MAG: biopolymer transporter ExbD [Burkholderiaceae bacterium]|nr:biopolymer transporter ExbD [Burkholderiaceae bacterium]
MKFRTRSSEEPEINLIPFIDVLLVILIFLMLTTTYSKFTELQLTLPAANADAAKDRPHEVIIAIAADGRYAVNQEQVEGRGVAALTAAIRAAAPDKDSTVIISADAQTTQQAVITALEAARREGLVHITFAAQSGSDE